MKLISLLSVLILLLSSFAYASEGFPGRDKFPDVPYISIEDFQQGYKENKFMVVDVRSNFEYKVIQINGAYNIPVADDNFEQKIKLLASKTNKPIIFYCNGRRCMKSYQAAVKSKLSNIKVYDAGVFEWAKAYPLDTLLLGKPLENESQLISTTKLKEHFISLDDFEQLIPNSILIDVRDLHQRRGNGLFLLADKSVPLDNTKKLERYLNKAINENKTLLAYDEAGKTVRWLQYYLENKGITNYYFMEGGAKYYTYY
jgi:rhodanese-related sulfurtransferase